MLGHIAWPIEDRPVPAIILGPVQRAVRRGDESESIDRGPMCGRNTQADGNDAGSGIV